MTVDCKKNIIMVAVQNHRKELSLNQKNKGAAIEKPLFVVQGCLEMLSWFCTLVHLRLRLRWNPG